MTDVSGFCHKGVQVKTTKLKRKYNTAENSEVGEITVAMWEQMSDVEFHLRMSLKSLIYTLQWKITEAQQNQNLDKNVTFHTRSNTNYTSQKSSNFTGYASSTFSLKRALFRKTCFLSSVAVLGSVLQMGLISDRPHTILKGGWCLFS